MSEPPKRAVPTPAAKVPNPRRRPRSWMNTAAVALLGVAGVAVLLSATPSLLRAAGLGAPAKDFGLGDSDPRRLSTPPPGRPIVEPSPEDDDEEPIVTQLERDYPDGMWPGRRSPEEHAREKELFGARPRGGATLKLGRALGPLKLFDSPLAGAAIVALVAAGTTVQIVREAGDWAMVEARGSGGALNGWVQKSEISVR
jgi:hypothetical protein